MSMLDKEFGTGCVKITPAHDPNDFEVGKRHNLEEINILNDDATISSLGGKYAGMDRYEARKAMVADLDAQGLLVKVVPHNHSVGTHDRCGTTVEPMIKPQWFVRMDKMAKAANGRAETGRTGICSGKLRKRHICTGWRTSVTGVFPDSSGGDIVSRHITVTSAAKWSLQKKCRRSARNADAHIFIRMRIHWIPGSVLHYGHSPHLAGRTKHRNCSMQSAKHSN